MNEVDIAVAVAVAAARQHSWQWPSDDQWRCRARTADNNSWRAYQTLQLCPCLCWWRWLISSYGNRWLRTNMADWSACFAVIVCSSCYRFPCKWFVSLHWNYLDQFSDSCWPHWPLFSHAIFGWLFIKRGKILALPIGPRTMGRTGAVGWVAGTLKIFNLK